MRRGRGGVTSRPNAFGTPVFWSRVSGEVSTRPSCETRVMSSEAVPKARPIAEALAQNAALARLRERIDDSRRRYAAVAAVLPEALRQHLSPGPVDDAGWTLLAANPAVAAKARQWVPELEAALLAQGWAVSAVRVRVEGARTAG